ncbi:porin [Aromatoleum aromaticum]|uniref:porin n=1 Tax=Aromatoleum aromaticum TaxID=551760 RepID=UPI00145964DA|nr:porin [Aromatoleum aromaticum]NMG56177.1 porin [Aromatoleum aromaticum]
MKAKLTALALASVFSTPLLAQPNVTVYGVADAYFGYGEYDDNKFTGVNSGGLSGSRIGFKGSEDLGNGLKALFTLEYSLNLDRNDGIGTSSGARQQFVGLQGSFGFVGLGRQYAPGYFVNKYDTTGGSSALSPQIQLAKAAGATIDAGGGSRFNNAINYKSPSFGGLSVNAIYSFNEANQDEDRRTEDKLGVGVEYKGGALAAGLTYQQIEGGDIDRPDDQKEWMLGGAYDFGVVKVLGSYQQVKDALGNEGNTDKIYQIGAAVPVGSGHIHAAWGKLDADAGSDHDVKSWVLAYTYSLSKRTTLYTGFLHNDNEDETNQTNLASNKIDGVTVRGEDSDNFVIGVRHTF